MIDHGRALTLAATSIDFPLDSSEHGTLEEHVRACASCRTALAEFRRDAGRLAALPPITPPSWVRGRLERPHRSSPFLLLAAAALLLTGAGLAVAVGSGLVRDRTAVVVPTSRPSQPDVTAPAIVVPTIVPATAPSGSLLVRRTDPAETEPIPITFGLIDLASGSYRSLGVAVDATLSPDGRRVHLVQEDANCIPTLVTTNLEGVELQRIEGNFQAGDGPFAWSPDDGKVVFGRFVNGQPAGMCHSQGGTYGAAELLSAAFVIDVTNEWAVGAPVIAASAPARYGWSPDGRFISVADSSPRLWVLDPTSTDRIDLGPALATIGARDLSDARWAPDGSSIAFVYSSPVGNMVGLAVIAGPAARTIGPYGDVSNAPAWAPDGRLIAVVRSQKGGILTLLDVEGVRPEALLEQAAVDEFAPFGWSPDGSWLAGASTDGWVVLVSANGLEVKLVFQPPAGATVQFVGWAPG